MQRYGIGSDALRQYFHVDGTYVLARFKRIFLPWREKVLHPYDLITDIRIHNCTPTMQHWSREMEQPAAGQPQYAQEHSHSAAKWQSSH